MKHSCSKFVTVRSRDNRGLKRAHLVFMAAPQRSFGMVCVEAPAPQEETE
jgi:hypothetical protein